MNADDVAVPAKIPISVLVVIHTGDGQVLLLERADHPGFWQSVTGSLDFADEQLRETCRREVCEETGLNYPASAFVDWQQTNQYEILAHWLKRYGPSVTHNVEHMFSLCLPSTLPVTLAPREHLQYVWQPWRDAADRCFSMTNVAAIRSLVGRGLITNADSSGGKQKAVDG